MPDLSICLKEDLNEFVFVRCCTTHNNELTQYWFTWGTQRGKTAEILAAASTVEFTDNFQHVNGIYEALVSNKHAL